MDEHISKIYTPRRAREKVGVCENIRVCMYEKSECGRVSQ